MVGRGLTDKVSLARNGVNIVFIDQQGQTFAQGGAADIIKLGQLMLRRQDVAGLHLTLFDFSFYVVYDIEV